MSEIGNFYTPEKMDVESIIEPYQRAYREWPWFENSKCVDARPVRRCEGGLSRTAIGALCNECKLSPNKLAYEREELLEMFDNFAVTRPMFWYTEKVSQDIALAAESWLATPEDIALEKYADVPEMKDELVAIFGQEKIVWLDDIFADKSIRAAGNLRNFGAMCLGFMERLGSPIMAYRTINPAMAHSALRDFDSAAGLFMRGVAISDRRDFVIITNEKE